MATRTELVAAVIERYERGDRSERGRILDEFVAVTGHHRKHAMKVRAGGRKRRSSPPSAAVRRSVPVRTFADWDDPAPGYLEADLVAHSGPVARGSFLQTLVLTDVATGWTECAPAERK